MSSMLIPVIVLHAKDDVMVNYEQAEFYHEHMTGSQLISFESGGHGMASKLKAVRDSITVFIENNHMIEDEAATPI